MTSSLRRIEWNKILSSISLFYILVFWPHFCSEASHGQCCNLYVWTKNYPQVVGTCSGHHGQLISQNCVLTKIRAEPPPPPPLKLPEHFTFVEAEQVRYTRQTSAIINNVDKTLIKCNIRPTGGRFRDCFFYRTMDL